MDQGWLTTPILGLSPVSIAVAVVVFALIGIVALARPAESRLTRRVQMLNGLRPSEGHEGGLGLLRRLRGWAISLVQVEVVQKFIADWVFRQSAIGTEKRKLLLQAGLRQPRMLIYFEVIRALSGLIAGAGAFYLLTRGAAPSLNLALQISLTVLALFIGLYLPTVVLKRRVRSRRQQFNTYWDDAIGLLIICLDAGLSIEVALRRIAHELVVTAPVLAEEFTITVSDLSFLKERRLAYLNLSERMDLPSVKSVTIALIQAEKQGASIANSLRTIAASNRQARISRAEERAASLGPKMTVPMIIFFLPVLFVIIIAPVILGANL